MTDTFKYGLYDKNSVISGYYGSTPGQTVDEKLKSLGLIEEPKQTSGGLLSDIEEANDTGVGTKIKEAFVGGLKDIKEAGEGIATGDFNIAEGFARGAAGAIKSAASPITGAVGELLEEGVERLPEDFKKNVSDIAEPTIENVYNWYQGQSDSQKRNLNNIGVGLELLLSFAGGQTIKKPIEEIIQEGIDTVKKSGQAIGDATKNIKLPEIKGKSTDDKILENLDLQTVKGNIDGQEVDVPVVDRSLSQKIIGKFENKTNKELAGRAVSPRTVGKNAKQKLQSISDVENRVNQLYKNIRTGKLVGEIDTLENAAQTIVDNLDTVGARIGDAVKKVDGDISVDNPLTDKMINALNTKGSEVSPATGVLKKFYDSLGDGNLKVSDAYELKKAYSNEVTKLYKAGDAGTAQYKALSDGVEFLNKQIDNIIDTQLGKQFANDKELYRSLKVLVDDMVASALVEGRKAPESFAERIGKIESIFSPVSSVKQKLIKDADELNQRGGAWAELIKRYDEEAVKNLKSK